jgi:hypothetical protein
MTPIPPPAPAHTPAAIRRGRRLLILIALIFFGPLGLAFFMYYGATGLAPQHQVNHGALITPVRPLPAVHLPTPDGGMTSETFLRRTWSLVYVTGTHCDARCQSTLADLHTVRLVLHAEAPRVSRVLLGHPDCCTAAEAGGKEVDLVSAWLTGPDADKLLARLRTDDSAPEEAGRVYLVDPLGNLLMTYTTPIDKKGLLKDLDKLLRLSHIG